MKVHQLTQTQIINSDIDTVWGFFCSPRNLNKITPPDMNFEIIDLGGTEEMQKGQRIKYKVSPFPFLRVTWITEITDVDSKRFFVDNQVKGPFTLWRHRHTFKPFAGGVEMVDQVDYAIPVGVIGVLINKLMVRQRVRRIFEYRKKQIELIFPKITR